MWKTVRFYISKYNTCGSAGQLSRAPDHLGAPRYDSAYTGRMLWIGAQILPFLLPCW